MLVATWRGGLVGSSGVKGRAMMVRQKRGRGRKRQQAHQRRAGDSPKT
jgi:hypothetical protein